MPTRRLAQVILEDQNVAFPRPQKASKAKLSAQPLTPQPILSSKTFTEGVGLVAFQTQMVANLAGQKHPLSKRMQPFQFTLQTLALIAEFSKLLTSNVCHTGIVRCACTDCNAGTDCTACTDCSACTHHFTCADCHMR